MAAAAFPASPAYYNLFITSVPQLSSTSTATITTLSIPGAMHLTLLSQLWWNLL
ncbi:hypothetical protein [Paenibacillus sp. OSY-SE]|uniref:hypothetical protein n=1 Tax=Paenibacillus sp. OSY-SE TaxID=1196323 RepID=UPI003FCDEF73